MLYQFCDSISINLRYWIIQSHNFHVTNWIPMKLITSNRTNPKKKHGIKLVGVQIVHQIFGKWLRWNDWGEHLIFHFSESHFFTSSDSLYLSIFISNTRVALICHQLKCDADHQQRKVLCGTIFSLAKHHIRISFFTDYLCV